MLPVEISGATEHNLKFLSVSIPKNRLVVVAGVSGSGKSSLIYDVLFREAEIRYLGSMSSVARQFMGRLKRPSVEAIAGLTPAIAVDQRSVVSSPRSTVGTLCGIWDLLRLLYARTGRLPEGDAFPLSRSLFSFNAPEGACPACKGLGVEDHLDPELLVADASKTLREGALVITAPNGYIIYSQVTLDVLDQVCRSEGFHIDIPWKDLTPEQKHIILYGSTKIEIPFGKHPLESRMKWSGITAKPRELGHYKGILPVMEEILKRDRNRNILRFVRSVPCRRCGGSGLNDQARSVTVGHRSIDRFASLPAAALAETLAKACGDEGTSAVSAAILDKIRELTELLQRLGLGYLSCDRRSDTLSGGESQRLRLATLAGIGLSNLICIFDEPSVGLHPRDVGQLIGVLKTIRDRGNTVIVVEHDEQFMREAEWLIDIGPGPGARGGELLFAGTPADVFRLPAEVAGKSRTLSFLRGMEHRPRRETRRNGTGTLRIEGATAFNLKNIDVTFLLGAVNVVTGVSGAGKSTLTEHILASFLRNRLHDGPPPEGGFRRITGWETISRLIDIDQSPIGRTPRSNPATYTGLFDAIRELFAKLPAAQEKGFDRGRFSFNTAGGRCETCEGAGYQQEGMHFLGMVEVPCETCEGKRFDDETLSVRYHGRSISDILALTVAEAIEFFSGEPKILRYLETLASLGLGYLTLGQRSSTLSGGEAQRVKLAAELARPQATRTIYLMDEPTTGLHQADTGVLLDALQRLADHGHTVIVTEHHREVILAADHVTDLGPGSGQEGGAVVYSGPPEGLLSCPSSFTGMALSQVPALPGTPVRSPQASDSIALHGVTTHNLKNISVVIPKEKITVITGVSGSGKSSLALDTLAAEGRNRFLDSFSPYLRSRIGLMERPGFEEITGLTPTFAIDQSSAGRNPRSTVGTITGIYDLYRLLYSRFAEPPGDMAGTPLSSLFSFNHRRGACADCSGLGFLTVCDPARLVTDPSLPVTGGALRGTRTGAFYGDPDGQYMATLLAAGAMHGMNFDLPWKDLDTGSRDLALYGSGERMYEVTWRFRREGRTGEHRFSGPWKGLVNLVNEEYVRKHADHRGESMLPIMHEAPCPTCGGARINPLAKGYRLNGLSIDQLAELPAEEAMEFLHRIPAKAEGAPDGGLSYSRLSGEILRRLELMKRLGLGHMGISRPASTLSSGESRRIRLAGQLASGLTGLTYVIDEPTCGMHQREIPGLMDVMKELTRQGNTVVLVEHDPEVIRQADHVIRIGPGAGRDGGAIMEPGSPAGVDPEDYQAEKRDRILCPEPAIKETLALHGISARNLKGFDLFLPAGAMTVITGVSGSGRSTLFHQVIKATAVTGIATGCRSAEGFGIFSRVVDAGEREAYRTSTGVPATLTGIFDRVRTLFARMAARQGSTLPKSAFSFLNREGRCPVCEGNGRIRVSMDFLPDVVSVCETCGGTRYRPEVLEILYNGKNIADVLSLTVTDSERFFRTEPEIAGKAALLVRTGLGYLTLGQPLDTLSGGEARRLALAVELMNPGPGKTLFLFDEPSAGLHPVDFRHLLRLFRELILAGHTIIVNDNDPAAAEAANLCVTLGPGGGLKESGGNSGGGVSKA